MIDDLKYIHDKDHSDALGVAERQCDQLTQQFNVEINYENISNIIICGMGGSALPAQYFFSWSERNKPLEIIRNYSIPTYVNSNTLAIISSYSGNTEETLSALNEAQNRGAKIIVVTAGGKLKEIAGSNNLPLLLIPSGIQPRMSTFYFLSAFCYALEKVGVIKKGSQAELAGIHEWIKSEISNLVVTVPTTNNQAKQLAKDLIGKSVVVYSGPKLFPAANKLKIGLNENAKNIAFSYQYPEFNHNEFIGWSAQPVDKPYAVVEFQSNLENPRILKRFEISERLLSGRRPMPSIVKPHGDSLIKQLIWTSVFSDFTSIYVALLNGIDPTPVNLVEQLKVELNKS